MVSDIPFALPTIVAGLVLLSLYGPSSPLGVNWANTRVAVFLASCSSHCPSSCALVQPVLLELEQEVEEAAASISHPDSVPQPTFSSLVKVPERGLQACRPR